jgi:hypothetical protein
MKSPSDFPQTLTLLGALNFVALQWLGIRLAKIVHVSLGKKEHTIGWSLLVGIVPLTGWWSRYIGPVTSWALKAPPEEAPPEEA